MKRANGFCRRLTPEEQQAVLERVPAEERLRGLNPEEYHPGSAEMKRMSGEGGDRLSGVQGP